MITYKQLSENFSNDRIKSNWNWPTKKSTIRIYMSDFFDFKNLDIIVRTAINNNWIKIIKFNKKSIEILGLDFVVKNIYKIEIDYVEE